MRIELDLFWKICLGLALIGWLQEGGVARTVNAWKEILNLEKK